MRAAHDCSSPSVDLHRRSGMRWASACALAALGLSGCGGGEPPKVDVAFTTLIPSAYRLLPRGTYIFNRRADWQALWDISPSQFPNDPFPTAEKTLPAVDFDRHMLIVISLELGIRCNMPDIVSIVDQGQQRLVTWRTNEDTGITTSACLHRFPLFVLALAPAAQALQVVFTK